MFTFLGMMKDGEFEELTAEYCAQMGEIVIGNTMQWPLYRPLLPIIGKLAKQIQEGLKMILEINPGTKITSG